MMTEVVLEQPEVVLMLELHHRFSVAEAASLAQKLPPGTVDMLEEPIRDESPEAFATLRTLTEIPFAVGEEFSSKWQFLPFIERGLHQYCRVDLGNVGVRLDLPASTQFGGQMEVEESVLVLARPSLC